MRLTNVMMLLKLLRRSRVNLRVYVQNSKIQKKNYTNRLTNKSRRMLNFRNARINLRKHRRNSFK